MVGCDPGKIYHNLLMNVCVQILENDTEFL